MIIRSMNGQPIGNTCTKNGTKFLKPPPNKVLHVRNPAELEQEAWFIKIIPQMITAADKVFEIGKAYINLFTGY